ncbi:hypothetical protein KC349_g217 [Hortaea werneckii]|nr:hypothetical protein KC349_g217 [Hortaea werneckii]
MSKDKAYYERIFHLRRLRNNSKHLQRARVSHDSHLSSTGKLQMFQGFLLLTRFGPCALIKLDALPSALKRTHVFVVVLLRIHEDSMHARKDLLSRFCKRKVRSSDVIWTLPVSIVGNAGFCGRLSQS